MDLDLRKAVIIAFLGGMGITPLSMALLGLNIRNSAVEGISSVLLWPGFLVAFWWRRPPGDVPFPTADGLIVGFVVNSVVWGIPFFLLLALLDYLLEVRNRKHWVTLQELAKRKKARINGIR